MDTYNHNTETYMNRMNQTALSKFESVKPYLAPGQILLDFGSGFSPEFIDEVKGTGATYVACDASPIVQEKLHALGITTITQDELTTAEEQFDVIFLSSVFHELISYLSDVEYERTLDSLVGALRLRCCIRIEIGYGSERIKLPSCKIQRYKNYAHRNGIQNRGTLEREKDSAQSVSFYR